MKVELGLPADRQGNAFRLYEPSKMKYFHSHDELEFNVVLRGKSGFLLDNRRYFLGPDTLVWLFPNQEHMLLEHSKDFEMWVVVLRPELVRQTCTSESYRILLEENPLGFFCRRVVPSQTARLDPLLRALEDGREDAAMFNAGLAYALTLAWSIYSTADDIPASADLHPAVENAVNLLKREPQIEDLAELAERAGLSPGRLSRLFNQQIGESIVPFKNRLRIQRFLQLYQKGHRKNMMQAALEAGFGSYPQFHREFARIMGCSPAAFRRQHR